MMYIDTMKHIFVMFTGFSQIFATDTSGNSLSNNQNQTSPKGLPNETHTDMNSRMLSIEKSMILNTTSTEMNFKLFSDEGRSNKETYTLHSSNLFHRHGYEINPGSNEQPSIDTAINHVNSDCNFKNGMHFDICGKCVNNSGYSNECKVCSGGIDCPFCPSSPDTKQDQCGQCLKLEDRGWNNCTRTLSMFPKVIDVVAVDKYGIVYLKGVGLIEDSLPNLECFVHNSVSNRFLLVSSVLLVKNRIQIKFEMNDVENEYRVYCNTTNEDAILGVHNLTIINSNSLSILMLSPSSVMLGRAVEFLVIVRGMSTLSEIVCFIKTKNNVLVTTLPTDKIQGNSLVTNITCPLYTPTCADNFVFGVAYTYEAIAKLGNSNTKKLEVRTSAPDLKSQYLSPDLRQVVFEFNDNVEGPPNCAHLFIPMTLHLLGNKPVCQYSANFLRIILGQQASLKSINDIKFNPGQIRSACGTPSNAPAFSGNIYVEPSTDTHELLNKPLYKLIGPSEICVADGSFNTHYLLALMDRKMSHYEYLKSSSTSQFVVHSLGNEEIQYKWTLRYYFETDEAGGVRQRRNLLVWLSVRELEKILKTVTKSEVTIDNSLLVPKVKYVLSVIGQNRLDKSGESVNITFELLTSSNKSITKDQLELTIIGSPVLNPFTDNWFEAIITSSCYNDELNNTFKFMWMIDKIGEFPTQIGPKLFLPERTLKSNSSYTITCEMKLNSRTISKNNFNFCTTSPKFKITIGTSDIVFGTGQTFQLWSAIDSTLATRNSFEYNWSCNYNGGNECYLPFSNSTRIKDIFKSEFKKKILTLKRGSLMVGVYSFKVSATLKEENLTILSSPTRVRIVEGEPPLVSIEKYPIFMVNPKEDLNIVAKVNRIHPGCRISWDFLRTTGSSYFELNSVINNTTYYVPIDSDIIVKEFTLKVPGKLPGCMEENDCNLLQENANYTLAFAVSCSAKLHSYATTKFQTVVLPKLYNLEVRPREGVGLITEFQFTTEPAYSFQEYQPLEYSFGFKISGEKPLYFYTSSNWLNHKTVLPSLSDILESPTMVETILKVCNKHGICASRLGPSVFTSIPKNVTLQMLNSLRFMYSTYLKNEDYNEAFSLAFGFFKTLKSPGNQLAYQNLSQLIESEIIQQIDTVTKYMENNSKYHMKSAVALIESVTATIQYLLHSDILLGKLVSFKKKVLRIFKEFNNSTVEVKSLFSDSSYRKKLLSKKHMKSESLFWKARFQRQISILPQSREEVLTLDTVKTMLEASEVAILNFTHQENAVSEVRELLQNVDYYVSSLCDQTFNDGKRIYIGTKVAELSVKRIHLDASCTEEMPLPDCMTECFSSKAYIKLGEKLAKTFPDNDNICYASLIYPSDYLSTVYSGNALNNDLRLSNVYSVKLMTQSYFEPKTEEEEVYYVEMKIPIKNVVSENGFTLKCFVWIMERREWIPDLCQSHVVEDGSRFIRCECPVNHYISVFAVNDTTEFEESTEFDNLLEEEQNLNHVTAFSESMHQLTTKPDWELVSLAYHRVTFRIDEDYEAVVGQKRKEFIESLKNQLVDRFQIPFDMFKNVTVYPGTVMVSMQLVNSTSVSVSDILPTLVRALNFGELKLSGINGQALNIPPQLLQISEKLIGIDNDSYQALLVVLIGFLICIAVFISFTIAAIVLKRKEDKLTDETEETANDLNFPKYRELYFEQSIDGSEATLNQYRRPVQVQFQADSNGEDSGISIIPELARHCVTENGVVASNNVHCNVLQRSFLPGSTAENM